MPTYRMVYGDAGQVVRETFHDVEVEREHGWSFSSAARTRSARARSPCGMAGSRNGWQRVVTAVVLGGARIPIGRYGGSLSHTRTDDLLAFAIRAVGRSRRDRPGAFEEIAGRRGERCARRARRHRPLGRIGRRLSRPRACVHGHRFCASSLTAARSCQLDQRRRVRPHARGRCGVDEPIRMGVKMEQSFAPRGPQFFLDAMWAGAGGPARPRSGRHRARTCR